MFVCKSDYLRFGIQRLDNLFGVLAYFGEPNNIGKFKSEPFVQLLLRLENPMQEKFKLVRIVCLVCVHDKQFGRATCLYLLEPLVNAVPRPANLVRVCGWVANQVYISLHINSSNMFSLFPSVPFSAQEFHNSPCVRPPM